MTKPLSPTAKQTRQKIMNTFWELYKDGGIEKTSVTKICELTGYNRSTFYTYFTDVYDVLDEIEKDVISFDKFKSVIFSNIIEHDKKEVPLRVFIDFYEENNDYLVVLLGEHGDPSFRQKTIKKLAPGVFSLLGITNTEDKYLNYLIEYQSSAVLSTITKWYQNGKDIPCDELITLLYNITTNGVQHEFIQYKKSL